MFTLRNVTCLADGRSSALYSPPMERPWRLFLTLLLILACEPAVAVDPTPDATTTDEVEPELEAEPLLPMPNEAVSDAPELATVMPVHPRDRYDWSRAAYAIYFDEDGTPFLRGDKPRLTKSVKARTMEVHRHVVREGLGVRGSEPDLWRFLATRSSIETSGQGSQLPLDGRGVVHALDTKAAYRAGSRLRPSYVEAGNKMAESQKWLFLGYGPQGQNSWLYLDDWDPKGDPRMLADTVISDLTYVRVLRKKYAMLSSGRITCPQWDNVGQMMKTPWNGKRYRVGRWAVDTEAYDTCMSAGPERPKGGKLESNRAHEKRCRRANRLTYEWRPGMETPSTSAPVPILDWWELKRAANGKPCPPWKGDEYEEALRARFEKHARRYGFESKYRSKVRKRDLGAEPEGDQYDLWHAIWSSIVLELDGEPLDWEKLEGFEPISTPFEGPSPEKLKQDKLLARDPLALEREHKPGKYK